MNIKNREPIYVISGNKEYVIRPGSSGVDKNKVVYFYDVTKTIAVGFPRDACIENPQIFQVSRTLIDKDISARDVMKVIEEADISQQQKNELLMKIESL